MTTKRGQNEGTVFTRADGYVVGRISLGKDADGKRRQKTIYGAPGTPLAEVRQRLRALLHQHDQGKAIPTGKGSVAAFLEEWLAFIKAEGRLRQRTIAGYEGHVQRYIIPAIGHLKLARLSKKDVQSFLIAAEPRPRADGNKGRTVAKLSGRTMNHCRAVLRTALEQAAEWDLIASNPAAGKMRGPPIVTEDARYLPSEEARRLLAVLDGDRLGALFLTMIITGMRPSEAYGLTWERLDLDAGIVQIRESLEQHHETKAWSLAGLKTSKSRRDLPIPEMVTAALRAHRQRQDEEKEAFKAEWKAAPLPRLVFTSRGGMPLDGAHVRRTLRGLLDKAGLPHATPYALRHTAASLLMASGEHPRVIMSVLGHSQIALTMNTYSHVAPELHRGATEKLGRLLAGGG